jgi:hypothetical protein
MADFSSALTNPLVAQYLSGLGADLMKYGGNTNEGLQLNKTNEITAQNIKSNNMMKLLQHALGPDGSSVKVGAGKVDISIPADSEMYKNLTGEMGLGDTSKALDTTTTATTTPTVGATQPQVSTTAPSATTQPIINPFNITPPTVSNPMAGITPEMMAGIDPQTLGMVLNAKAAQDTLKQTKYRDFVESMYKGSVLPGTLAHTAAQTKLANVQAAELTPSIDVMVGDKLMKVSPKDAIAWKKMEKETTPAKIKEFEYARDNGYTGSVVEFMNLEKTVDIKNFEMAKKEGYKGNFNTWLTAQNTSKAINLGSALEKKKAMSELEGQLYFSDPKWTNDVSKQVDAFDKGQLWSVAEKDRPLARSKVIVKSIEDKIAGGNGDIQKVVMDKDNKTMIWTVKWPSGDIKTIKHAVK